MRILFTRFRGCLLVIAAVTSAQANTSIYPVSAVPRTDGSGIVDITYNLSGWQTPLKVSMLISADGGTTFPIVPSSISGDVGSDIPPGNNKHIVWNAAQDLPGASGSGYKVKLFTDAVPANGQLCLEDDGNRVYTRLTVGSITIDNGYGAYRVCRSQEWPVGDHRVTVEYVSMQNPGPAQPCVYFWWCCDDTSGFTFLDTNGNRIDPCFTLASPGESKEFILRNQSGAGQGYSNLFSLNLSSVTLASLRLDKDSIAGGDTVDGTLELTGVATTGGLAVSLSSSDPSLVKVPNFVLFSQGDTSKTFEISTQSVTETKTVTITASHNQVTKTVSLKITPRLRLILLDEQNKELPKELRPSIRPRYRDDSMIKTYYLTGLINVPYHKIIVKLMYGDQVAQDENVTVNVYGYGDVKVAGHLEHTGWVTHGWIFDENPGTDDCGFKVDTVTPVLKTSYGGDTRPGMLPIKLTAGEGFFYYVPPEISCSDTIRTEAADRNDIEYAEWKVDIKINGLIDLTAAADFSEYPNGIWLSVGRTNVHPAAHYCTASTKNWLMKMAGLYQQFQTADTQIQGWVNELANIQIPSWLVQIHPEWKKGYDFPFPTDKLRYQGTPMVLSRTNEPLLVNDISLPWGGLFDVFGTYDSPHGGHRFGNHVDIKTTHLVRGNPLHAGYHDTIGDLRLGPMPYVDKTVWKMDKLIRNIQFRRLILLRRAFLKVANESGGRVVQEEGNHFHVSFP